jgi:hypothetical protein
MSADTANSQEERAQRTALQSLAIRHWPWALLIGAGALFVLVGAGNLDPGPIEAKLGISAGEGFGPLGRVFGGWEPSIWPARLAPSVIWAWGEGVNPTAASIRWPSAIAALLAGLLLAGRVMNVLDRWSGILVGLCWFGAIAQMDLSAGAGIDMITGLATVAALDRILARGADRLAGLYSALAFLAGGWPPLALIALASIVIGRRDTCLTFRFLAIPLIAFVGWSAWALESMQASAWAAALALPLTERPAWRMAIGVFALGLPWSPFALFAASRSVRDGWSESGRGLVLGWLQVVGASLLVGTLVPGLSTAARVPALAGLAIASGACCQRLWLRQASIGVQRGFLALAALVIICWMLVAIVGGVYLGCAVPYYRILSIVLVSLVLPIAALTLRSIFRSDPRRAVLALTLVAACLKVAHWGYYVPEWNYRRSQGPWGRAIGQWVPPRWPVYTTHSWQPDLAFAIGRPVRQLPHPKSLAFLPEGRPKHVLLLESEFTHWPEGAPRLVRIVTLHDQYPYGEPRVLARTEGVFSWRLARLIPEE